MSSEEVSMAQDRFRSGAPNSEWYQNLERYGSCLKLLSLLKEDRSLIHQLGPEDITVSHKGVEHGCVALVGFILVGMFDDEGFCNCSLHGADSLSFTREQLLRKTSSYGSTAVNMAVVSGSPKMVILLKWAIEMSKHMSGGLTNEMSSSKDGHTSGYKNIEAIYSTSMRKKGHVEEIEEESANDLQVPEVKDEDISILPELSSNRMNTRVISVIEGILEDPGEGIDKGWMDMLKERCENDVDFEFVPIAHVFPHFLVGLVGDSHSSKIHGEFLKFGCAVLKKIIGACKNVYDGEEGGNCAMLTTLFNILDPRGRTLLHASFTDEESISPLLHSLIVMMNDEDIPSTIKTKCMNARDGAGRTFPHLMIIYNVRLNIDLFAFNWNSVLAMGEQLNVLKEWCFPFSLWKNYVWMPNLSMIQFATICNATNYFYYLCPLVGEGVFASFTKMEYMISLQLAAVLGRIEILEHILKHHTKFNSSYDQGFGHSRGFIPAIHCAALFGQVESIQSILKFPVYDPIVQSWPHGTALHLLLNNGKAKIQFQYLRDILLSHLLPSSKSYKRLNNDFLKLELDEGIKPKMYSANEISCINLLLQAGIDIWTPNAFTKQFPSPGPMANNEARKWWYEKVVHEVVTLKMSISNAANATSVIAALVATASFIGPFQPPLGYGDSNGHYVQTDRSPVRAYLVCNSLSFFFSIASILMAVLPAIPMPKESLYDELLRSQRCLKGAALMLLISIICILISFSSASFAVVPLNWRERQLIVACVISGGMICVGVLVIYIIRLLRMLYHRNDWFRRKFAKHMYF